MKKKRFLAALVCLIMILTLLPSTAYAADGYVLIKGESVSLGTPYYFNGNGTSGTPTKNGADWNAHLEKNADDTYTLHLRGLDISTDQPQALRTMNIATLYLSLEGDNSVIALSGDSGAAAIACDALIVCGDGTLTARSENAGYAINASLSIELQYSAKLTVYGKGGNAASDATNRRVICIEGSNAYNAADGSDAEITGYFANADTFLGKPFVRFTPKTDAPFPVWVNGIRVTAANKDNVLNDSGTVKYTPAAGATPAVLTLNGATIDSCQTYGGYRGGIYAEGSLEIKLKGSNSINISTNSANLYTSGVLLNGSDLIFTAEPGASLSSQVTAHVGASSNCYGIYAGGGGHGNITVNGGDITAQGYALTGEGRGIKVDGILTVNGGSIIAEGSDTSASENIAVRADSLVLGSGMAITAPTNAMAPDSGIKHIRNSDGTAAEYVEIGRARYTVTYDSNGGGGTMTPGTATDGTAFTMPSCSFTAPAGQRFKEWAVGSTSGTKVAANGTHTFTANTTVYAIWEDAPAIPDPIKYQITEGENGEWRGSSSGLRFTVNADFGKFIDVVVDGSVVPNDKYTVKSGSTIITFNASYLKTLSAGQHTLHINFTDGYAETTFTVKNNAPATGDNLQLLLWLSVALITGAGLAAGLIVRRKRQNG